MAITKRSFRTKARRIHNAARRKRMATRKARAHSIKLYNTNLNQLRMNVNAAMQPTRQQVAAATIQNSVAVHNLAPAGTKRGRTKKTMATMNVNRAEGTRRSSRIAGAAPLHGPLEYKRKTGTRKTKYSNLANLMGLLSVRN